MSAVFRVLGDTTLLRQPSGHACLACGAEITQSQAFTGHCRACNLKNTLKKSVPQ